jgi:hypothetical protein
VTPFPKKPVPVVKGGLRPPVTWSYSVLTGFEACPHRHHAVKVARTHAEKVSDQNAPGQEAHRAFERRITRGARLPDELSRYDAVLRTSPTPASPSRPRRGSGSTTSCARWASSTTASGAAS